MFHEWASQWYRLTRGTPCFRIFGKGRREASFAVIDVFSTPLRNRDSKWPFFRGTCITWTHSIISVGEDFAAALLREQAENPATRECPQRVLSGRYGDGNRRAAGGFSTNCSASELLAHECGHTGQARRMGAWYWFMGAAFTRFREGDNWWNEFENEASEHGCFGGIVAGSII